MIRQYVIPAGETLNIPGPIHCLAVVAAHRQTRLTWDSGEVEEDPALASRVFGGGACSVPRFLRVEAGSPLGDVDMAGEGDGEGRDRGRFRAPPVVVLVGAAPGDAVLSFTAGLQLLDQGPAEL